MDSTTTQNNGNNQSNQQHVEDEFIMFIENVKKEVDCVPYHLE